jgi:hypothetical protein
VKRKLAKGFHVEFWLCFDGLAEGEAEGAEEMGKDETWREDEMWKTDSYRTGIPPGIAPSIPWGEPPSNRFM